VAVLFLGVFGAMKNSEAYKESLAKAQASPALQEAIGTPIKDTFFVAGSVATENGKDTAELAYAVTGPKGGAAVTVSGVKESGGSWVYSKMEAIVDGKEPINLLAE
jgi:hypothetical protein